MRLPNADVAIVDERKVAEYLLNPAHPDNGGKAAFFTALGFSRESAAELIGALAALAQEGEVVQEVESSHGRKYVVDGAIRSPAGKSAGVRSVWIIDLGEEGPRLVTAYPSDK